jgi:hypothetical protein
MDVAEGSAQNTTYFGRGISCLAVHPGVPIRIILFTVSMSIIYGLVLFDSLGSCLQSRQNIPFWGEEPGVNGPPSLYKEMYMCLTILVSNCCELAFAAYHNVTILGIMIRFN